MGCRAITNQADLIRFAVVDGELREGRTLPGRGAWLHPRRACFEAAVARRAFARSLRVGGRLLIIPVDFTDTWPRSA